MSISKKIVKLIPEPVKAIRRELLFQAQKRKYAKAAKSYEFNLHREFISDPARINRYLIFDPLKLDKFKDKGTVQGGDWDLKYGEFTDLDSFQAIRDCVHGNGDWKLTEFYARTIKEIESGKVRWGCTNAEDLDKRLDKIRSLYLDIKNHGFKTQIESGQKNLAFDEISVCIDRNGVLLFHDGRHRLSIAKLLNLKAIPIQVTLCHQEWFDFCKEVMAELEVRGGKLYAPLLHPMLSDLPSVHTHERFDLMKANLPVQSGTVLDIGAHWGYFCQQFEGLGFNCTAIELDKRTAYFMRKLRDAEGQSFNIFEGGVFSFKEYKFDIVLALYIFHHFLKEKEVFEKFISFLQKLEIQAMFLSCHDPAEPQMAGAYKNFAPDEFADFIISHTKLSKKKMLGSFHDDRKLFLLTK